MPHNLHIVLVEPQIPLNTGSIGRVCLATETALHLVEPLGFEIDDYHLRRAGLDYWEHLTVTRHKDLPAFLESVPAHAPKFFFSARGTRPHYDCRFEKGSYLFFGSEVKGLPKELLEENAGRVFRVPQYDPRVRSLNLANVASVVVYEAMRQLGP
ncbi:MAG: tRNA (cytidine(34)-2'-O)-methyltransferase [Nitrospinae bacterium]|nr:tRNA (cytidine(34)-2'-O)-methyltransferase [Nitrospinota bacterium]